jgi:hypothetical protein
VGIDLTPIAIDVPIKKFLGLLAGFFESLESARCSKNPP